MTSRWQISNYRSCTEAINTEIMIAQAAIKPMATPYSIVANGITMAITDIDLLRLRLQQTAVRLE